MMLVSLIIPTYNEAQNIRPLVEEIFGQCDKTKIDLEIIFVDDNSPDGTGSVAEGLAERYPIKVIHRAGKNGLGSAVIAGFAASDRPYIGVMDADLSHDPAIMNALITALVSHDIAIGSRYEMTSRVESWQWWRKLTSNIGVALARRLTKTRDPLSGYFFVRRSVIDGITLTTKGYKILFEILIKGSYRPVVEIPFTFRVRKYSTSKLNYQEYLLFAKQLAVYAFTKKRNNSV